METTFAPSTSETGSAATKRSGHAGFLEYAGVAIQSLHANKLRSFLTLLGIIIGIASIIAVISIIQGLDRYWKEKVSNFGPNTFIVTQYPITTNFDEFIKMLKRNEEVRASDAEAIRRYCTACDEIGVETHKSVRVRYGRNSLEQVDMGGMTPNIMDIEGKHIDQGRSFGEWEEEHSRFVAIIGSEIAEKLFPGIDPVGKSLQIEDHWYTIVGVGEKKGTVFGFSQDNYVKVPLSTFQKIYGSRRSVNISIRARPGEMQQAQDQSRLVMRSLHRLNYHDEDDFGLITSEGVNELFNNLTQVIFSVSLFVVGISLVVGGIVIMNIMLVSVVERTKEIGIRKAVGARQQDVVNQFLVESVVLCCAGGAGGVALAYLISWMLATFTPLPSTFPLWAPLLAFVLSTIIGVFFGIYPARRAGRLDPIEALRAE
ncbi:MAG TPA: ABC transporter permease [Blastocatellia bacterium]|nr:ABC transporter permease [Blastocatellia bacterium]